MINKSADISLRAQVLTLSYCTFVTVEFIATATGYSVPNIYRIRRIAKDRGFDPHTSLQILDKYTRHEEKSGRPRKATTEKEDEVIDLIIKDRYAREKTSAQLTREVELSRSTVWRILKRRGYRKVKPSFKSGLISEMKAARLAFCLLYKDWIVEDWKRVIWIDETAIVLDHRREAVRIWRTVKEGRKSVKSTVRVRWHEAHEFMFWECFSYDWKGPCHCWKSKTKEEKAEVKVWLDEMNAALKISERENWELINDMRRLSTRNLLGKKPQWKWDENHEKMIRKEDKGGIDWWRYQQIILLSKLISFAEQCNKKRRDLELSDMLVQEDKASSHVFKHQQPIFSRHEIERLLWLDNSPDLNMIESCWSWMKRRTTSKGPSTSRLIAEPLWNRTWDELPQENIQAWIERIPRHIAKIIELEGGNEYCERRLDVDERTKEEKMRLQKLRKELLNIKAKSVSSSSSSATSTRSSFRQSNDDTLSSLNVKAVISKPPTSKALTPPALRRNDVLSSKNHLPFRIQKITRTTASFRPKKR
jgi:transposase